MIGLLNVGFNTAGAQAVAAYSGGEDFLKRAGGVQPIDAVFADDVEVVACGLQGINGGVSERGQGLPVEQVLIGINQSLTGADVEAVPMREDKVDGFFLVGGKDAFCGAFNSVAVSAACGIQHLVVGGEMVELFIFEHQNLSERSGIAEINSAFRGYGERRLLIRAEQHPPDLNIVDAGNLAVERGCCSGQGNNCGKKYADRTINAHFFPLG